MEDLKVKTCEIHSGNPFSEWCSYCNQALCKTCIEYHQKSKVSTLHSTKPIGNYEKLPDIAKCINRTCLFHNDMVEFYCEMHEDPCCFQCITDTHRLCEGIVPLVEVNRRERNYATMRYMQNKLKEMNKTLNEIITSRLENLNLLEKQETRNISKIKQIRNNMTNYLKRLEQQAIVEVKERMKGDKNCLQNIIDELNQQIEKNNRLHKDIEQIRAFADNLQLLVATKSLSNEIKELDIRLKEIQTDRHSFDVELSFDEAVSIQNFQISYPLLGRVTILEKPNVFANNEQVKEYTDIQRSNADDSEQFYYPWKELEELMDDGDYLRQCSRMPSVKSLKDIKLNKEDEYSEVTGDRIQITFCKLLPNGDVLVLDWGSNSLVLTDKNCILRTKTRFPSRPYGLTYIEGDVVAVTLRSIMAVSVVNIRRAKEVKRIRTQHYCYGIVYKENRLYVSVPHLCLIQVLDYETGDELEMVKIPYQAFNIAIMADKIYCTSHNNHLVFCCNMKGDIIWELRQPALKEPFCISADPNGYVYIACRKQSKIIRISIDGKIGRVFNCSNTGLSHISAVDFSESSACLLICAEASPTYVILPTDIAF